MGGSLSRLWSMVWTKKEIRILILGLDNAGKTTLLYRLKIGEVVTTIPTIGFNVESVTYRNLNLNVWDLGGQTSIRPYWRCYYANTAAVIFVIDSTDIERLGTAADELAAMLNEEELHDAALLVFANKQDQPGAKGAGDISEALKLGELRDRNWSIVACSAIDGKGVEEGMDWLVIAAVVPSSSTSTTDVQITTMHPVPRPGDGEVLVKLEFSGVCHSDVHSIRRDTPMSTDVAGHEGIGKVIQVGTGVDETQWIGQRVGISSCLQCEICAINHTACPYQKNAGANVPGTFQQYIVSPAMHVTKIPAGLSPETAAPLLCAGISMYSSITKSRARPGDWLVIPGAGGGLGHLGVQVAVKKGIKVIAVDTGEKKEQLCLSLGATWFLDYQKVDVVETVISLTSGLGAHAVICTANSERVYEQSMKMLRPLGTLVCIGIPNTPFRLPATPFEMIIKGLTIVGNSAGTAKEMDELLEIAVAGDVKTHVEVFGLTEISDVLQRLERADVDGRAVLRIPE
ncbi:hypothetical protein N7474_010976 [Penicillium riverlandense]|uniref:uncharacterized protein n=1 Tax=Penicillium riverlandense TaxID=1903569 RepID=UPI002546D6BE|nr:uncharacterized protein N7474_010976 [Penicillium riverlandense]KAJ5805089.1 hypothetical protein N7474_010976 [Penicillium riverlandense]